MHRREFLVRAGSGAQASHLGNIAYVQRRRIKFDTIREEVLPL